MQSAHAITHAIKFNHMQACVLTRIRHRPRVEADEIESLINAPDEGGKQTYSDAIRGHREPDHRSSVEIQSDAIRGHRCNLHF